MLFPLGLFAVVLTHAMASHGLPFFKDPIVITGLGALVLAPPLYFMSRGKRPEVAAWVTVLAANAATWVSLLSTTDTAFRASTPYFIGLGPILATAFLPLGATLGLVLLNMLGLLLLPLLSRDYSWFQAVNPLLFLAILSGFILIVSGIRHQDLQQIQKQRDSLVESESRYRHLFHSGFDAIFIHDNGRIIAANHAAGILFQTPVADMVGRHVLEFTAPKDQPQVVAAVKGRRPEMYTMRATRRDGSEIDVEVMGKAIRYGGKDVRLVAIRDITERRRAEENARRALEQDVEIRRLREVSEYKSAIFNMAAHELNTPLTPVRMQLHILRHFLAKDMEPRAQKALAIVDRNMDRLTVLVHDFLDVARIEHGVLRLDPAPVDVAQVAKDCVDSFQAQASRLAVRLSLEVGRTPDAPDTTIADPKRLIEVLYNLVSNAMRFTPTGGSVCVRVLKEPACVRVTVEDTGVGIAPEELERLFHAFSSLRAGREGEGTGLGLYICKGFVEAHGGRISASSDGPGKGSRFVFELPVRTLATVRALPPAPSAHGTVGQRSPEAAPLIGADAPRVQPSPWTEGP